MLSQRTFNTCCNYHGVPDSHISNQPQKAFALTWWHGPRWWCRHARRRVVAASSTRPNSRAQPQQASANQHPRFNTANNHILLQTSQICITNCITRAYCSHLVAWPMAGEQACQAEGSTRQQQAAAAGARAPQAAAACSAASSAATVAAALAAAALLLLRGLQGRSAEGAEAWEGVCGSDAGRQFAVGLCGAACGFAARAEYKDNERLVYVCTRTQPLRSKVTASFATP